MNRIVPRTSRPMEARLTVIGGGAGGVGRSSFAWDFASQLCRRGRRVLLVDANLNVPEHYLRLVVAPPQPSEDTPGIDEPDVDWTRYISRVGPERPALLSLGFSRRGASFPMRLRATRLHGWLRAADFDDVIVDLDSSDSPFNASLLALCDVPILMASARSTSLLATAQSLRAMVVYGLLLQPEAERYERQLLDELESLPLMFRPGELYSALKRDSLRPLAQRVTRGAAPWLLFNHTRDDNERDLAQAYAFALSMLCGVRPRVLGALAFDDKRWFHEMQTKARTFSGDVGGDSINDLVHRYLNLEMYADEQPRMAPHEMQRPTDLIGVAADLEPNAIRKAWRRLWDSLRRDSPLTRQVIPPAVRDTLIQQLEEANQVLQGWLQSREQSTPNAAPQERRPSQRAACAARLERARLATKTSITNLSLLTRIGVRYIEAIEAFDLDALPREAYLRGYLREIARAVGLDPDQIVQDYLSELHAEKSRRLDD